MKKFILFLSVFSLLFVSCEKDPVVDKGRLDPNAMILIRPADGVKLRAGDTEHLTALEIVQQTWNMPFKSHYADNEYRDEAGQMSRGFADTQRDYEIPALKMWGTDIIDQRGNFFKDFIYGYDFILVTEEYTDTIAYIPNSVIVGARTQIEAAYNDENYTEAYRLFDEAFTFLPITGAEWRALKVAGEN